MAGIVVPAWTKWLACVGSVIRHLGSATGASTSNSVALCEIHERSAIVIFIICSLLSSCLLARTAT